MRKTGKTYQKKRSQKQQPFETKIRNKFYTSLFLIFIGIFLVWIAFQYTKANVIGIIGVIILFWQAFSLISNVGAYLSTFFPVTVCYSETASDLKWKRFLNFLSFLGGMSLIVQIKQYEDTLNQGYLLLIGLFAGFLMAIFLLKAVKKQRPTLFGDQERQSSLYMAIPMGFTCWGSFIAIWLNTFVANNNPTICYNCTVTEKNYTTSKGGTQYFFDLQFSDGRMVHYKVSESLHDEIETGEKVTFCLAKGLLGTEYVKDITPVFKENR